MPTHLECLKNYWKEVEAAKEGDEDIILRGTKSSLDLAEVVAIARYSVSASIDESNDLHEEINKGIEVLNRRLENGENVYGVNTGCGANADTRTSHLHLLQHAFLQHHHTGLLPEPQIPCGFWNGFHGTSNSLSHDTVRATMLLRCNTLLRGFSAVRLDIIKLILSALNKDLIPLIPQRGSISASGDLMPLSYLGGLVEGNRDIFVRTKDLSQQNVQVISAAEALTRGGFEPVKLRAKEALGLMNGTAPSAGASALTLFDSHNVLVMAQILTAMATEALEGIADNFNDIFGHCRPHTGQIEVARNIRQFLEGSKLCHWGMKNNPQGSTAKTAGLVQDRYSLRTAPQWLGPLIEDLLAADKQVRTELNSVTDNPLIDPERGTFHQGGNFQAASMTSAMEKTRTSLVMIGKLLLSQCNEVINPALSKGLTPNLCIDDPSTSFTCKGVDVNMTAYYSELAYLANSVVSHVQSADMSNQGVNSLALIAARYTSESADIVFMMCAAHLYVLCQALDIRALTKDFLRTVEPEISSSYHALVSKQTHDRSLPCDELWAAITEFWLKTSSLDLDDRCEKIAADCVGTAFNLSADLPDSARQEFHTLLLEWRIQLPEILSRNFKKTRSEFIEHQTTSTYLGATTGAMYGFVRQKLGVPLHQGLEDHPSSAAGLPETKDRKTIGSYITQIYAALRNGEFVQAIQGV
ncbi:hypothetical protein PENSTE_c001G03569 [Penicillium steckii]|uniref:Phenylalanine ammonia-lyase n=1 Tax=Penicillium steckii TaxID=303698 RepID=A0A1V6U194_9EURO|nr:hypothetical protein PENSTE_c001G03569 [Penicillium steckii]